ncbi:alpha/beta fold hydrolase [Marinobacter mobilis]|uniref:alpha/beta fold hydrolase n=1 Tax=Marinobacter mobilis TaxID=488533 RepID=UPI0035C70C95
MRIPTPDLWPLARTSHRWLQQTRRREAVVDNHRLVWLERGSPSAGRPTVVLLHGFTAMKENWGLWLPLLPRDWHLLVPDLPGFGESEYHANASYRYEIQASRLRNWLSSLNLDNVHLVGSSMGGAIASILAGRLEPEARSLTVLNSAGIPEHADVDINAPFTSDRDSILVPTSLPEVHRMFTSVGNGRTNPGALAITGLLGPDLISREHAHRHIFSDMVADGLAPARYLDSQTIPLQVQWGARDVITPTCCVDYFRRVRPEADIHVFRGVGHLPMLEAPKRSASALIRFVRAQSTY